ncbi:MAG TPA: sigma-70 family RNA polymerase sigma factor, partial [Tepidimicrobium sp.]|nr:sigma-70 family RNA polymerase sigma factor [Tepidimicrobium sp.]
TKKVKFETYAYMRIRGSIIDELRKVDGVPQSIKNNAKTLQEAFSYLEQTLGRTVEDEDLCKYLNITSDELNNLYKSIAPLTTTIPFDDFILPDDTYFLENPMDVLIEKKETCKILGEAIAELPKKEKTVITLYYYEDLNFKEISKVLDLSQGRISQLHTKAILRLRGKLSRRLKFP